MVVERFSKYSLPRIAHRIMLAVYPVMCRERITVIDRFVRYALVGGISTLTYLGMLAFLVEYFNLDPVLSSVTCFIVIVLLAYILNYLWVFESERTHKKVLPRFLVVSFLGLMMNTGVMYFTVNIIGLWYIWGQVCAAVFIPVTNFVMNFYWSFT